MKREARIIWFSQSCFLLYFLLISNLWQGQASSSVATPAEITYPIRRKRIPRVLQSWMIHHNSIPKTRSVGSSSSSQSFQDTKGSIITFSRPTKERLARWFVAEEDPNDVIRSMLIRKEFNHDSVGMTNPYLHCEGVEEDINLLLRVQSVDRVEEVSSTSKNIVENNNIEQSRSRDWWPTLSFSPVHQKKWRVLKYRRRVGSGVDCYQLVRDAALDWEFRDDGDSVGLLAIPSASEMTPVLRNPPNLPRPHVAPRGRYIVTPVDDDDSNKQNENPIAFHRSIGGARRLVSYKVHKFFLFPKVYSVHPVMVVYDLVDQRAPGTTFTSTSFATMKGHLLRGEERVTVAMRDDSEAVDVEIISISREGPSLRGLVVWPFIHNMQTTFFERQMDFLEQVGRQHSQPSIPAVHNNNNTNHNNRRGREKNHRQRLPMIDNNIH